MSYNCLPPQEQASGTLTRSSTKEQLEAGETPEWMSFPGISFFPVFGSSIAQAFHMTAIIGIGAYFGWLALYSSAISKSLASSDSPQELELIKWFFVAFSISTFFRLILAWQYKQNDDIGLLWAAVESEAVLQKTEEKQNKVQVHDSITKPGNRIKGHVQKQQQKLRTGIIGSLVMPCLFCILLYIICLALKAGGVNVMPLFTSYVAPVTFVSWPGAASMTLVSGLTQVIALNVQRLSFILEEVEENGTVPCELFWIHMIKEYLALDQTIIRLFTQASNILALFLALMLVLAWLLVLQGISTISNSPGISCACFLLVALVGFYVLFVLFPLAQVNSKSHSLNAQKPSLLAVALRCGAMEMPTEQRVKYSSFLQIVQCCPLGSKCPVVGMVTTADLMNYARVIAIVLPGVLSYSFSMIREPSTEGRKL